MEIVKLKMTDLELNAGQVSGLPMNPREWTRTDIDRLARSIKETPELFEARPLLVVPNNGKYVILGGNLRFEASKALKVKEVPCIVFPASTPVSKLKEIVIKDNGSFGEWDFDALANEWADLDLSAWGTGVPDDWGKVPEPQAPAPGAGSSTIPGAENLPPELQGLDINPDDLPKLQGDDQTAMERIIIVYPKEQAEAIAQALGLETIDKVVYRFEEVPLLKPLSE